MKQAMIFAAGLGTRLKPLTDTMPKALVSVGGEPLLKRVLLKMRDSGFDRVIVNVHHFADQIVDYLYANNNFGMAISVSDETDKLLDTGGGIRKAEKLFDLYNPILIHNVDILSNVDLARFYSLDPKVTCPECGVPHLLAGAQLLVSWRKTRRYLVFNDQMLLVGWVNIATGEVKSPWPEVKKALEKEQYPIEATMLPMTLGGGKLHLYAFSGIHTFYPRFFPLMVGWPDKFPIIDFYLTNCKDMPVKGYCKDNLQIMDVGKLDTLQDADAFLNSLSNS